jgi:hypothetical protein
MDFFDDGDFSEYADDARKAVARRFGRSKASSSGSQKPAAPAAPGGGGGGLAAMMQGMAGGGGGAKMQPAMTAMAGGGDIKKAVSSAGFARTLKKAQGALRSASIGVARSLASLYIYIIVLLLLFIVHQATATRPTSLPLPPLLARGARARAPEQRVQSPETARLRSCSSGSMRTRTLPLSARRCSST